MRKVPIKNFSSLVNAASILEKSLKQVVISQAKTISKLEAKNQALIDKLADTQSALDTATTKRTAKPVWRLINFDHFR